MLTMSYLEAVDGPFPPANRCARGFQTLETDNLLDVAEKICAGPWSPCRWAGGIRCRDNFLGANLWAMDFDGGATIRDIQARLAGFAHIIGLTKSHQREKGDKPACDRFRVVIPAGGMCADLEQYEANLQAIAKGWGADGACKDGGRFFYPCVRIHCIENGEPMPWPPAAPPAPSPRLSPEQLSRWRHYRRYRYERWGEMEPWLKAFLNDGRLVKADGRNNTVYAAAVALRQLGFDGERALAKIRAAPISREEFPDDELTRTVASAFRRNMPHV